MNCPGCGNTLKTEIYEGTEIDRCPGCGGTFLDSGELKKIVQTKEESFGPELIHETIVSAYAGIPQDEKRKIVRCPECLTAMRSVNYDYRSGIIIDMCPKCYGVWLDRSELEKVQAHREHWDQESEKHADEWMALAKSVEEDRRGVADENRKRNMRPTKYLVNSLFRKMLGGV